ncbi:phospholipase A2 [Nonomuraea basaltis]|uniref:phospholipase A2 n=1 Tax=Nonomuraea basaltis TaxID=2495887 RepID=UPI001485C8FF|nr:phospholipase A2 [Nonomuraea basaltis]
MPCARHDFAYYNVRKLASSEQWKSQYKRTVDKAFSSDMLRSCDGLFTVKKAACKVVAWEFYAAVTLGGK